MTIQMIFENVLTDILREIERCPDDSLQDIANEALERWECDWRVDQSYVPANPVIGGK